MLSLRTRSILLHLKLSAALNLRVWLTVVALPIAIFDDIERGFSIIITHFMGNHNFS